MKHHVDVHVGQRIRQRRWMLGMTQKQLGEAVGIKFQQIQKYESGANRVSASRLFDISQILDTPVSYFFETIEEVAGEATSAAVDQPAEDVIPADLFYGREAHDLLRSYYRWPEEQRRRLFDLTRSLSEVSEERSEAA